LKTDSIVLTAFILLLLIFVVSISPSGNPQKSGISNSGIAYSNSIIVFDNAALTNVTNKINWGTLYPGTTAFYDIWIKNVVQSDVILQLKTAGWRPENASNYLFLTWNTTLQTKLAPGTVGHYQLRLDCSPSIRGISGFSFNVTLT